MANRLMIQLAALTILASGCGGDGPGELVLYNGKIFTADTAAPWVSAVLIRGDRIAVIGADADVLGAAGSAAARVDLGGRTAVPGFNDAHDHIAPAVSGVAFATVADPLPEPTFAQVVDSLRAVAGRTPAGTWLRTLVGARVLFDPAARRSTLDRIAPDHPVELVAWTGHGMILNSRALTALGVSDTAADPLAGHRERDAAGRLTGLLEEYASYGVWLVREKPTDADVVAAFRARGNEAAALGITSIQDMVLGMAPEMIARVADTLRLPYRLRLMPLPLTSARGRVLEGWDALRSVSVAGITVSGTKWILDGTPVERLALHRAAYEDRPGWYGRANFPVDTLRAMLREALDSRTQPVLHAVGDSAIALALTVMGELGSDSAWRRLRPRIEHGDGLGPDQFARAVELGIVISQNPSHYALGPMIGDRFGPRVATYQPQRSLLQAGIPLALGSDGPINPFLNLMFALVHPDNPAEAITMEQAVRAYTWGSAYAEHAEGDKGRLLPGMLADLAVLSQDIFSVPPGQLPGTTSVLTVMGGRVVHDPTGLAAAPAP